MKSLQLWWQQPDQYGWLSDYLAARGLQRPTRLIVGAITGAFVVVPIVMLWSPSGPKGMTGAVAALTMSTLCAGMALIWLSRWPTKRQSAWFTVAGNVSVAIGVAIAGTPMAGLLACTSFAPLSGYVSLFGSSRLLTLTLANAAFATAVAATRVGMTGDIALAAGHLLAIAIAVLAVPFAAQLLLRLMTLDAMMSHTDALTGLRNRRGFHRSALDIIAAAPPNSMPSFTVVMVDLDGFKLINDSQGHSVGDRILIAVADNLRRASRVNSVVARIGGEEFLIADLSDSAQARVTAEAMRAAVASTPWHVTASVGAATVTLINDQRDAALEAIEHLIAAADAAMYEAKRSGGNQVRHSGVATPPTPIRRRQTQQPHPR